MAKSYLYLFCSTVRLLHDYYNFSLVSSMISILTYSYRPPLYTLYGLPFLLYSATPKNHPAGRDLPARSPSSKDRRLFFHIQRHRKPLQCCLQYHSALLHFIEHYGSTKFTVEPRLEPFCLWINQADEIHRHQWSRPSALSGFRVRSQVKHRLDNLGDVGLRVTNPEPWDVSAHQNLEKKFKRWVRALKRECRNGDPKKHPLLILGHRLSWF